MLETETEIFLGSEIKGGGRGVGSRPYSSDYAPTSSKKSSQQAAIFAILMDSLYDHPRNFKFSSSNNITKQHVFWDYLTVYYSHGFNKNMDYLTVISFK